MKKSEPTLHASLASTNSDEEPLSGMKPRREPGADEKHVEVSGIQLQWTPSEGICDFEGLPVAMMWVDTTLAGVMAGVQTMVGTERFGLALQHEGRKSVEADWSVISQFEDFAEGFEAIANIAAVAGWGRWELISLDADARTCRFRVSDSWEGRYQRTLGVCWGSGMLAGKLAGYCSKLFAVNCWAEQTAFIARGDARDEFVVAPSARSIEEEVDRLLVTDKATRADMAVALVKLREEVLRRTKAEDQVRRAQQTLERKVEERTAELRVANARLHEEIVERRATEEALRASEERYRKVVSTAPVAFVVWHLDGHVIEWNEHAETTFGWTRQEAIGADFFKLIVPESTSESESAVVRELRAGRVGRTVKENVTKDGRILACEWSNSFLHDAEGHVAGIMSIVLDITERKEAEAKRLELERQILHAQKLDSLGVLAGGIAHDFNNILMGVLGNAELARINLPSDSPARANLERVEIAARRAADLAQQMLAYSGRGHFAIEPIRLNDVVNEMMHLLETIISKKAKLQVSLADNVPIIEGDVTQIRQIVMNLLTNASEAIGERTGTITLSTGVAEATEEERALARSEGAELRQYALLNVADDGCGMDLQTRERIFDPFFTTKFTGRGLGLAAVLGICRGHKAKIDIDSEPGRGTTFRLSFPSSAEVPYAKPDADTARGDWRGSGTILFVDDEEIVLEVATEVLCECGFDVVVASDGQAAVDIFRERPEDFDAVVLDMTMPRMSGEEALGEMRRLRPDVPVILSSGYDAPRGTGSSSFIQKPYRPSELIDKLRKVLGVE